MSTSTMHFGPEWMRAKPQPASKTLTSPSPPPGSAGLSSGASILGTSHSQNSLLHPEKRDDAHPYRYTKEDMLKIYREHSGQVSLGPDVERWEGVVREAAGDPIGLKDLDEAEKKLFNTPLNSDLRRRQSSDFLSPLATQNLGPERRSSGTTSSPLRDRFGTLKRRESMEQPLGNTPRKLSLSGAQGMSPRDIGLPSPRTRYTPGFDGVLNGGDSWVSRRRASEALKPPQESLDEPRDSNQADGKHRDPNLIPAVPDAGTAHNVDAQEINSRLQQAHIGTNVQTAPPGPTGNGLPPLGPTDLTAVEWSYLDPQGQLQGPFRADLMQKWHNDGYFTTDLLMKRTTMDKDWLTVGELLCLAPSDRIFLTPPPAPLPSIPPGLSRRRESPQIADAHSFTAPYQPSPVRSLRNPIEAFGGGSNLSDSPSSSIGNGRFSNDSPDPNVIGARLNGHYPLDLSAGVRAVNYPIGTDLQTTFTGGRRNAFNDPPPSSGGLSSVYSAPQSPWGTTGVNIGPQYDLPAHTRDPQFNAPFAQSPNVLQGATFSSHSSPYRNGEYPPVDHTFVANHMDEPIAVLSHNGYASHPHINNSLPQQVQFAPIQPASRIMPHLPIPLQEVAPPVSPWGPLTMENVEIRQPGPFDATHPTSSKTTVQATVPGWGTPSESVPVPSEDTGSVWIHSTVETLPTSEPEPLVSPALQATAPSPPSELVESAPVATELADTPKPAQPSKKSKKPTSTATNVQPVKPATEAPTPSPTSQTQSQPIPTPAVPKAAWSTADTSDVKVNKPSGVTLSLREIQVAETKKAEARKVADREKEKAMRAAIPAPSTPDEAPSFTASWGLPTSQTGARSTVKESNAPGSASASPATPVTSTPVWTNVVGNMAVKTKKSMKEILEEEERRKKLSLKEKESVASIAARSAAGRGYADSTTKSITAANPIANPWTTVGPSGKLASSPSAAGPPARPSVPGSAPSSSTLPRPNGLPARPPPQSGNNTKPAVIVRSASASNAAPVDDHHPLPPSHEFVKWLNDALKGLNNSVNVEEIMQMLLSFPIDPDLSTVEIISDLIYANSTTLDGRRFAAEFTSKRKADALTHHPGLSSRTIATAKAAPAISTTIADVVKSQPKATGSSGSGGEWGGFKVVNKKKKGGRP